MANVEWEDEDTWNAFIDQLTVEEMAGLMLQTFSVCFLIVQCKVFDAVNNPVVLH